jgi:hypothetical protein
MVYFYNGELLHLMQRFNLINSVSKHVSGLKNKNRVTFALILTHKTPTGDQNQKILLIKTLFKFPRIF